MMLDKNGIGEVSFQEYQTFWIGFMYMYGEIMHENMNYSEDSEQLTRETFNFIANSSLPE